MNEKIHTYAGALKTSRGRMLLMKTAGLAIVAGLGKAVMTMKEFLDETGLSYSQLLKLSPAILIAGDEARALMDEFGGINNVTGKTLISMKLLNFQYGISADSTAKLLGQMEAISNYSREQLLNQIKSNAELARANGVAPAQVMEDVASNTEFFAQYAKDGGDNIFKAAIKARKLGLSIDAIASSTDNLLDFESSIESQMEASVLLGRQINLDKARQLAFMGETSKLAEELKNQVGSEAEFNRMNVIQRKALAGAVGLNVEQLSKLIRNQETSKDLADKFKAK